MRYCRSLNVIEWYFSKFVSKKIWDHSMILESITVSQFDCAIYWKVQSRE